MDALASHARDYCHVTVLGHARVRVFPFHRRCDACVHIYTADGWDVTAARTHDRRVDIVSTSRQRYQTRPSHGHWPLCYHDYVRCLAMALAMTIFFVGELTMLGRARVTCAPPFSPLFQCLPAFMSFSVWLLCDRAHTYERSVDLASTLVYRARDEHAHARGCARITRTHVQY